MERYEHRFLAASFAMLVVFMAALLYSVFGAGVSIPGRGQFIQCSVDQKLRKVLRNTPPFDKPGVHQTAAHKFDVVVIGQTWSFTPDDIELPVGAEVTFYATSADVVHGFEVAGTRVNMMLMPNEASSETYTFKRAGEYLLLCHEYCGNLHHTMSGKVVVK